MPHDRTGYGATDDPDHASPARGRRTHRSGLLERRGRPSARNLPQDGEGSLRRASAEARSAAAPSDSDCLPAAHGRGSAVRGAPVHACGPASPLTRGRARGGAQPRAPSVIDGARVEPSDPGDVGQEMTTTATVPEARIRKRRIVERPRLYALLDESSARVRTLVAPAGYGKTTLAEQWVARDGRTATWYTARSSSTDVAALALGIARSATAIIDGCDHRLREHMRALPAPAENVETLAEILGEDLADWPATAWLVLDDYHEVAQEPRAEDFVGALVAVSPVQFLIASRVRPAWVTYEGSDVRGDPRAESDGAGDGQSGSGRACSSTAAHDRHRVWSRSPMDGQQSSGSRASPRPRSKRTRSQSRSRCTATSQTKSSALSGRKCGRA